MTTLTAPIGSVSKRVPTVETLTPTAFSKSTHIGGPTKAHHEKANSGNQLNRHKEPISYICQV